MAMFTRIQPADTLRRAMQARRWSQADCAKAFGVTQPAVSRWLSGERVPRHPKVRLFLLKQGADPRCL